MPREFANATIPATLTLLMTLTLPYGYTQAVGVGGSAHIFAALFWSFISTYYTSGIMVNAPGGVIAALLYTALRFAAVFQVYRYYNGGSTRGQTIAFAFISELPPLFLSLPSIFGVRSLLGLLYDFVLPLPTLLVFVIILVFALSPRQPKAAW